MITVPKRIDLIKQLPAGAIGAQIGVWRGYFSVEILNNTRVGRLYDIDAWAGQTGVYDDAGKPKSTEEHHADFTEAQHHLRGFLKNGRSVIIRGFSVDVARDDRTIPPLDFVYIDADHTYDGAFADMEAWAPRLKPGGVIMGHDYTANDFARRHKFGVIEAVRDFCAKYGWEMTHITDEDFASYQLAKILAWTGAEL